MKISANKPTPGNAFAFAAKYMFGVYGPKGLSVKKKILGKTYQRDIYLAYLTGCVELAGFILKEQQAGEYETIEEIVGDLQLIAVDMWKDYKKHHNPKTFRIDIEDFLQ
jgi:hypothetical protein